MTAKISSPICRPLAWVEAFSANWLTVRLVMADCCDTRITSTRKPRIIFITAPATTTMMRFHTGARVKERSSSDASSSPSMLTKPPMGSSRSA